ncbi:macrophage mannose receptor 1-like, partial [Paramuricea clavata]
PTAPTYDAANKLKFGLVGNGVTGVWMSSATHYWPLSNVDNGSIAGTIDGRAFGNIKVITGVKDKPDSALQFSESGMYIDVPFYAQDCLTFPDTCPSKHLTLSFMASFDATAANWQNVAILDSLGGNKENSTGISVTINQQKLVFVVSYVDRLWTVSIPIEGDGVWRHYVMTCSPIAIEVLVNGKSAISRAYVPNLRKTIHSKNLKRNFHIGLQTASKVSSGALNLTMLAFWEGILPEKDIQAIYKTEFGWCPNGWIAFGMSCYEFTTGGSSWNDARSRCQSLGGDLATISTPVEQALITGQIKTTSWIGLVGTQRRYSRFISRRPYIRRLYQRRRFHTITPTTAIKFNFVWQNHSPARYTNWRALTTYSYRGARICVCALGSSGSWAKYPCTSNPSSICEKEKDETRAAVNTTIVDVPKFTRVCQYSHTLLSCPSGSVIKIQRGFWGRKQRDLCRFVSIIDCGLDTEPAITDKLRKQCDGSSICKVEASNDPKHLGNPCLGVYKYLEVNYTCGLKGTVKDPCPPGWIRSKHDSVACYRLIPSKKSWSDSEKTCKGYGAKLISIRDKSEQVFATSLMERAWNTDVWIGLSDENTSNTFKWSDGIPVSWTNWAVGNPRGAWTGDHQCVYMNLERTTKELMYWRGGECSEKKLFICKKIISKFYSGYEFYK